MIAKTFLSNQLGFGGMTETFKPASGMKIEETHPDKLHFEGSVWDRTAACGMGSESPPKKEENNKTKEHFYFCLSKRSALSSRVKHLQQFKAI